MTEERKTEISEEELLQVSGGSEILLERADKNQAGGASVSANAAAKGTIPAPGAGQAVAKEESLHKGFLNNMMGMFS